MAATSTTEPFKPQRDLHFRIVAWDAVDSEEWRAVTGREEAVRRSTEMNDDHKRLLIDDLALMDEWLDALDAHEAAQAARRRASRTS